MFIHVDHVIGKSVIDLVPFGQENSSIILSLSTRFWILSKGFNSLTVYIILAYHYYLVYKFSIVQYYVCICLWYKLTIWVLSIFTYTINIIIFSCYINHTLLSHIYEYSTSVPLPWSVTFCHIVVMPVIVILHLIIIISGCDINEYKWLGWSELVGRNQCVIMVGLIIYMLASLKICDYILKEDWEKLIFNISSCAPDFC